jgi:hypothetical protein
VAVSFVACRRQCKRMCWPCGAHWDPGGMGRIVQMAGRDRNNLKRSEGSSGRCSS